LLTYLAIKLSFVSTICNSFKFALFYLQKLDKNGQELGKFVQKMDFSKTRLLSPLILYRWLKLYPLVSSSLFVIQFLIRHIASVAPVFSVDKHLLRFI